MGLDLTAKRVVVVGAGTVAARRITKLLRAGALVRVIAPQTTAMIESMWRDEKIEWIRRPWQSGDTAEAWLIIAATDDADVNSTVAAEAHDHRLWCVRSDSAPDSEAWMSATTEADGITVGVNASRDPKRAVVVRDGIEQALTNGTLPFGTSGGDADVALVGSGPGNPGLITVAGRRALHRADVVITDHLVPGELLDELDDDVDVIDAAKIPYGRQTSQETINQLLIDHARAGRRVVRLKGGDGFVFGRGAEEIDACVEADVPVRVIPGVSSALAGPISSGISVTERGIVHDFTVVSGHVPPEHPNSLTDWDSLAASTGTLVMLMAVKNRAAIAKRLMKAGKPAATPVRVVEKATTTDQRDLSLTLAELPEVDVSSPAVIVVGAVAGRVRLSR